jgi:hypothetical protein
VRAAVGKRELSLVFEPGRSIVANAGVLLTRVHYLKETEAHNFALVDAAMNDFIRPALYEAWVDIQYRQQRGSRRGKNLGRRRAGLRNRGLSRQGPQYRARGRQPARRARVPAPTALS